MKRAAKAHTTYASCSLVGELITVATTACRISALSATAIAAERGATADTKQAWLPPDAAMLVNLGDEESTVEVGRAGPETGSGGTGGRA
jgi:uncharacterized lipoprotein YbaY